MNRRTCLSLLASASLGAATGCLTSDAPNESGSTRSPMSSPTTSTESMDVSTPEPGSCEALDAPKPDTYEGLPEPKSYPEKPDSLDVESASEFLETYEVTYKYNELLAEAVGNNQCLKYLEMYETGSEIQSKATGFAGTVSVRGSSTGSVCPDEKGTDTPTPPPHADFPTMTADYYLTDRFLIRDGAAVECWG